MNIFKQTLSVGGFVHEKNANVMRPLLPAFHNITTYNTNVFATDLTLYDDGRMICNILSVGPDKSRLIGDPITCAVCLKYTKQ